MTFFQYQPFPQIINFLVKKHRLFDSLFSTEVMFVAFDRQTFALCPVFLHCLQTAVLNLQTLRK